MPTFRNQNGNYHLTDEQLAHIQESGRKGSWKCFQCDRTRSPGEGVRGLCHYCTDFFQPDPGSDYTWDDIAACGLCRSQ